MKIYTKSGDKGSTSLLGGKRVSKHDIRIEAYGTVDELNAYIGLLRAQPVNEARAQFLIDIQRELFTIGSVLAAQQGYENAQMPKLDDDAVASLEQAVDSMEALLPPITAFIIPGGHSSVSYGHIARTVCRKAERRVNRLHEKEGGAIAIVQYLNRLSDYLFVLCRMMAQELSVVEVPWKPKS